jgi:hypothetical protein
LNQLVDTGVQAIRLLQWWKIPRRGWIIILGELAVIITLSSWVYSEYVNNTYFQSYVNSLSPILLPIVSVGFGVTSATVATLLYFTMRNIRLRDEPKEELSKRRGASKKAIKKPLISSSKAERGFTGGLSSVQKEQASTFGTPGSKRGTGRGGSDEEDE